MTAPGGGGDEPTIERTEIASAAQRRLWYLDQTGPDLPLYNDSWALRLSGMLELERLQSALNGLVVRHQALRTGFMVRGGRLLQTVAAAAEVRFRLFDLSDLEPAGRAAAATRIMQEGVFTRMRLEQPGLARFGLLRFSSTEHVLALWVHHIVFDGESFGVFVRDLARAYAHDAAGGPQPPAAMQPADHAVWESRRWTPQRLDFARAFWRQRLSGCPVEPTPPFDAGSEPLFLGDSIEFELSRGLTADLAELGRRLNATMFMVFTALVAAALNRRTGRTDLAVGCPFSVREPAGADESVGMFVNTVVLRLDLSGAPTVRDLTGRVRATCVEAFTNGEFPFELFEGACPDASGRRRPPFTVWVLHDVWPAPMELDGLVLSREQAEFPWARFPLAVWLIEDAVGVAEPRVRVRFQFDTGLHRRASIEALARVFTATAVRAADDPDAPSVESR